MALRRPIALVSGLPREIPSSDQVVGDAGLMTAAALSGVAQTLSDVLGLTFRSLESFGSCGNGDQTQDHAAFIAAQTWCCTHDTILVLAQNKKYILDFPFTVKGTTVNAPTPHFKLQATGATLQLKGAGASMTYQGNWFVSKEFFEYAEFEGGTFIPDGAGTQSAINILLKYIPSQWFANFNIRNVRGRLTNPNDQTVYWSTFINVFNGWSGTISGVCASQPFGKLAGTFLNIDGLSAGVKTFGVQGSWWDKGNRIGYEIVVGLKGSITSGTFLVGERVIGQSSGCTAYVCASGPFTNSAGTYNLLVNDRSGGTNNGDFNQAGETLTGQTSGAVYALAATGTAIAYVPNEGYYAALGEFVDVNTGFHFDCNTGGTFIRQQLGHNISSFHVNSRKYGVLAANTDEVMLSNMLIYCLGTAQWCGVNLTACNSWTITPSVQIKGQGNTQNSLGLGISASRGGIIEPNITLCTTGVAVAADVTYANFGFTFDKCTSDVSNAATVLSINPGTPAANSWYRTVSRQAGFVGGYNK